MSFLWAAFIFTEVSSRSYNAESDKMHQSAFFQASVAALFQEISKSFIKESFSKFHVVQNFIKKAKSKKRPIVKAIQVKT